MSREYSIIKIQDSNLYEKFELNSLDWFKIFYDTPAINYRNHKNSVSRFESHFPFVLSDYFNRSELFERIIRVGLYDFDLNMTLKDIFLMAEKILHWCGGSRIVFQCDDSYLEKVKKKNKKLNMPITGSLYIS